MIDTIKLAYPLDRELFHLLESKSERLQKLSPDGELLWEKSVVQGNCLPSHYSGLRVTTRRSEDLNSGFRGKSVLQDLAFFEFSLQKWQSPSAYNNMNSHLETDLEALAVWIRELSKVLGYIFNPELFTLFRVDLSRNYLLMNAKPADYLRSLELRFSRHPDSELRMSRTGSGVFLRSNWMGKKIYHKGQEFMDVERKKRKIYSVAYMAGERLESGELAIEAYDDKIVPLSPDEISDMMRMLRFECEYKNHFLNRYAFKTINDIGLLKERFESEAAKFMNIPVLIQGDSRLNAREEQVINLVRRVGYQEAKNIFISKHSRPTWYRIQQDLKKQSIHLEALDNIEYRFKGTEMFINPEALHFQLVVAPFQEMRFAA